MVAGGTGEAEIVTAAAAGWSWAGRVAGDSDESGAGSEGGAVEIVTAAW
jgi:hypothetical protein